MESQTLDGVVGCVPITISHPYSKQGVLINTINASPMVLKDGQCVHKLPYGRTANKAPPVSGVAGDIIIIYIYF